MIADTKISWDELTERGRIASEKLDSGRWEIGDLACEVAKIYGTDQMESFAREIGQKKETVKGYKRVARAFPESVRAKLFEQYPNLFYSHYRTAARLESPKEAFAFLKNASSNGWTTDEAEREMSLLLGKPERTANEQDSDIAFNVFVAEAEAWVTSTGDYLYIENQPEAQAALIALWKKHPANPKVKITITELPAE